METILNDVNPPALKKSYMNIIAGCLFAILAIRYGSYRYSANTTNILFAGYIIQAIFLFEKKRKPLACLGFGLGTIVGILRLVNDFNAESRISYLYVFKDFLYLIAYASAAALIIVILGKNITKAEKAQKIWFVPGIICTISVLIHAIGYPFNHLSRFFSMGIPTIIVEIIEAVAFFFTMYWFAYPNGAPKKAGNTNMELQDGYCGMVKHVLLLLFTGGIWMYIWVYKTTGYLNRAKGEEYCNPATKLLLFMFVPFYSIYWIYKSAQRIDKMANEKGIQSELSTLCLIMAIFLPLIALILMQDKINAIATTKGAL